MSSVSIVLSRASTVSCESCSGMAIDLSQCQRKHSQRPFLRRRLWRDHNTSCKSRLYNNNNAHLPRYVDASDSANYIPWHLVPAKHLRCSDMKKTMEVSILAQNKVVSWSKGFFCCFFCFSLAHIPNETGAKQLNIGCIDVRI